MNAFGIYGDRAAITEWWSLLKGCEYHIQINPPLEEEVPPESDGSVYRDGTVTKNGATVEIITTGGLCPNSNHPMRGVPALFIGYSGFLPRTRTRNRALAEELVAIFLQHGATLLEAPSVYRTKNREPEEGGDMDSTNTSGS